MLFSKADNLLFFSSLSRVASLSLVVNRQRKDNNEMSLEALHCRSGMANATFSVNVYQFDRA